MLIFAAKCYRCIATVMFVQSNDERAALLPRSAGRQKKVKFAMNLNKSQGKLMLVVDACE